MTEQEWDRSQLVGPMMRLVCENAGPVYEGPLLEDLRGLRRLRLFSVAVARRVLHLVSDPSLGEAVEAAEAYADGVGTMADLLAARSGVPGIAWEVSETSDLNSIRENLKYDCEDFADHAVAAVVCDADQCNLFHANAALALEGESMGREIARQASMFRDIFGNPFRPVVFSPEWRTPTIVSIAKGIYDSRDFSAMPILADALQDAGCEQAEILDHCRGSGPHVRGCWVVDLALGKS